MTGPLFVVAQWFLGLLPVDQSGRRVFDETLADWKSEATKASGPQGSATVSLRAVASVLRSIAMISSKELSTRKGLAPLLRLATWSFVSVLVFVAFNWNWSIPVEGVQVQIGSTAVLLGSVSSVLAFLPLVAFVSTATGRRGGAQVPRLGPALVAGLVMLGAMGWGMPAANQAWRELMFALSGGSGAISPGINERSIVELIGMLPGEKLGKVIAGLNVRLMFMVAVPVMLVLGVTARSLQGRRRVAGSVLPVLFLLLPFSSPNTIYGHVGWWPALLAAALVTRALSRAERGAGRGGRASVVA